MKRRIRKNIYGNWKGYVGREMVWDFGVDEVQAEAWLATGLTDSRSEEGARAWNEARERVQKRKCGGDVKVTRVNSGIYDVDIGGRTFCIERTDAGDEWILKEEKTFGDGYIDHFRTKRGALEYLRSIKGTREENPMKHFREPFHVDFHSERGEVSIHVTDADDNEVWYADTDTVNELIEDGFLDTKGFTMGRNIRPDVLERSVIAYLRSVGIIPDLSEKPRRSVWGSTREEHRPDLYTDNADLYDENPRQRTTRDVFVVQGNYGSGWDDEVEEDTKREALQRLKEYRENGPGVYRLIQRRVRVNNPGDVHIDIHSHNTRGSHVRAKNPYNENLDLARDEVTEVIDIPLKWKDTRRGRANLIGLTRSFVNEQNKRGEDFLFEQSDKNDVIRMIGFRKKNPTQSDVDGWVDRYRGSLQKRVDGIPEKSHYVIKIVTADGQDAWLRVGKGTKFDTDPAKARVYRNGDKANEAATKVANWLKKKQPAKWKKIATISAEAKK